MRRPYARGAAAAGIDFVAVVAAIGVIERWKDLNTPGEIAVHASNNIFATVALLHGIAAVFLFWFCSTLAARMRQLEGGSGRLAAAVNASGSIIAGVLAIGVGLMWAAHQLQSAESAAIVTSIVDGPTLFFPAAVLVGASGVVGFRAPGLPRLSRYVSWASIPLAAAFIAGAGLMLFKNYAWINDTGYIFFSAWILVLSIIGIARWGDLDGVLERAPAVDRIATREEIEEEEEEAEQETDDAPAPKPTPRRQPRKPRAGRKFAARNTDRARELQERLNAEQAEAEVDEVDEVDEDDEAAEDVSEPFFLDVTDDDDDDDDDLIQDVTPTHDADDDSDADDSDADDDDDSDSDTDSEEHEEFEYGGPPRMKKAVDVTPARRPARREPARREPARREPRKPAPRKPAAAKKTAPRKPKAAPRKPKPAPRARRGGGAGDSTEIIPTDER